MDIDNYEEKYLVRKLFSSFCCFVTFITASRRTYIGTRYGVQYVPGVVFVFYDEAGGGLIPLRLYFALTGTISYHGIRTISISFTQFDRCTAAPMKEHIRGQTYEFYDKTLIPLGVMFLQWF